jgi:hypothetical protein
MEYQKRYLTDPRTADERSYQSGVVQQLTESNMRRYNIRLRELPPKS